MIFLILAICCAVAFSLMFRIFQQKGINVSNAMLFNYVAGALFAGTGAIRASAGCEYSFTDIYPGTWTTVTACIIGILFVLGFLLMNLSTRNCGVAITSICARSAMAIPVVFSWLLLADSEPSWLLVTLVLVAVAMISIPQGGSVTGSKGIAAVSLVSLFLIFGTSDFLIKFISHQVSKGGEMVETRLAVATSIIFASAFVIALVICIVKGSFKESKCLWKDMLYGFLIGMANSGITLMTVRGLRYLSTSVFFPIFNIAVVALCFVAGVLCFKEKPGKIQIAGLLLALVSIVCFFLN